MSRKGQIGDEGTEQFTLITREGDKEIVRVQIHDPFHYTCISTTVGRWQAFKGIFKPIRLRYSVVLNGTEGAQRAIMMLDPVVLAEETKEILEERKASRERRNSIFDLVSVQGESMLDWGRRHSQRLGLGQGRAGMVVRIGFVGRRGRTR